MREDARRMPKTRIFLGPTLPQEEARQIVDVEYFPPIRHDDLPLAAAEGVEVVGIIDAAFIHSYTATPTQILECLRRGMVLFGAASAGALRAVETDRFGMRGVGGIYRLYKGGFEAEDELAVSYSPETLQPLSLAMINVRFALAEAREAAVITESSHDGLVRASKAIYFAHRSWPAIFRRVTECVDPAELGRLSAFLDTKGSALDWKRADAIECLHEIRRYVEQYGGRADTLRRQADASAPGDDVATALASRRDTERPPGLTPAIRP